MTAVAGGRAQGPGVPASAPAATPPGTTRAAWADEPLAAWADEPLAAFTARVWGAYGALGAGLVLVGVGADHLRHHAAASVLLLPLAAGVATLALLALRGPGRYLRVAGPVTSVAGAAGVTVGLLTSRAGAAELWALGLAVVGGVLLAVAARLEPQDAVVGEQDAAGARSTRAGDGGRRLVALAVGGLLASAATVPGLAATSAGEQAVPHGLHGLHSGHHG